MSKIFGSVCSLLCFVLISCGDQKPAPIQTVSGRGSAGGSGYLELTGPEFVSHNSQFAKM